MLIRGLFNRKDLNGRIGKIVGFDEKKQRYLLEAESVAELTVEGFKVRTNCVFNLAADPPTYDKAIEYSRLLLRRSHHAEAKSILYKAMMLNDERPEAFYGISGVWSAQDVAARAAEVALCAMERCKPGGVQWALATAAAFKALQHTQACDLIEPDWWTDKGLKQLSEDVVAAAYDEPMAHEMRADVLRGGRDARWGAAERSAKELEESAEASKRAKTLRQMEENEGYQEAG